MASSEMRKIVEGKSSTSNKGETEATKIKLRTRSTMHSELAKQDSTASIREHTTTDAATTGELSWEMAKMTRHAENRMAAESRIVLQSNAQQRAETTTNS